MANNPLRELNRLGQSVWLDYIERSILDNGTLARLIGEDGVAGLTSNPAIFEKAISGDEAYREEIDRLTRAGADRETLYSRLVLEDIGRAADLFRPVYEASGGRDGFVSIEVSPRLARDTQASIREARALWRELDRPNIMIKIPGTEEGLPAIQALLSEGINVNVTLLFSVPRYARVLETYLTALEERAAKGLPLDGIASVASFFLSRIDVKVDGLLDDIEGDEAREEAARGLRGGAAIASAALAYHHFQSVTAGDRWWKLEQAGAAVQRLLWASTGTKDPNYSDIKYVEPLVARDTVNTLPLDTLNAYRDHGRPELRIEQAMADADALLAGLETLGISLPAVTRALEEEGIRKFIDPYEKLLATLAHMREAG